MRRVRDVDPDAHAMTLLRLGTKLALNRHTSSARHSTRIDAVLTQSCARGISSRYGHEAARGILCRRRARELLAGCRVARRDAARCEPAGPRAREAARPPAARPLGTPCRPHRRRHAPLSRSPAAARVSRSSCSQRSAARPQARSPARSRSERRRGRRRSSFRSCSASSDRRTRRSTSACPCFDTQTVVSLVADRELELGIVGAARPPPCSGVRAVLLGRGDPRLRAGPPVRRQDDRRGRARRASPHPHAGRRRRPPAARRRASPAGHAACAT